MWGHTLSPEGSSELRAALWPAVVPASAMKLDKASSEDLRLTGRQEGQD